MIEASQRMIMINRQGEGMNPAIKRHLDLEIKMLQNAPRDVDKLEQLLQVKKKEKRKKLCTWRTHIGWLPRLKCSKLYCIYSAEKDRFLFFCYELIGHSSISILNLQLYIGCSGWSYDAWLGHFYPANLEPREFLKYYSHVFDFVEIDSSFYRPPNLFMTKRWASLTPDNFRFTAKFPRSITHEKRLLDPEKELHYFFDVMRPLRSKLLALLIQLPPSLTAKEGLKKLEALIHMLDPDFRYAIEVRNRSWFDNNKNVYKLLSDNNICLAWSQLDIIQTPAELTSDFAYLRFIGDRSIDEKDFGKVQKNRQRELKRWSDSVRRVRDKAKFVVAAANNHYAGFGPSTANSFRKMLGMKEEAVWEEMKQERF
jgi:uncharacterized protein YecE (DUF72 family)